MPRKKKARKTSVLRARVERALEDRQWGGLDLGDILDKARDDEVDALKPFVPAILAHRDWMVRTDALEFVGVHHLRQFLPLVKERLRDRNRIVRHYALSAYYDLLRSKALPLIKRACRARDIGLRVDALVLCYVETRDRDALSELRWILLRKRCRFSHRYAALNTFDAYVDVGHYPEIIELFEAVQAVLPEASRTCGLDKDIPNMLAKWKRSAKKGK